MQNQIPGGAIHILIKYLDDLGEDQLKRFKTCLRFYPVKMPYSPVSQHLLEKAGNIKIAEKMIEHYDECYALEIAGNLFHQINRMDLVEKIRLESQDFLHKKELSVTSSELSANRPLPAGIPRPAQGTGKPKVPNGKPGLAPSVTQHTGLLGSCETTELDLTYKTLEDSEFEQLCARLKDPGCKMQKLVMKNCFLTASDCTGLSIALRANTSLKELDLSSNTLTDFGVRDLCEGLKHPGCRIQRLVLDKCSLTEQCCAALASVLKANSFLKDLDLSHNTLWDCGVKQLSEGLKHPGCNIKAVWLIDCSLTGSCCPDLAAVLSAKPSLTLLYLNWNRLENSGVIALCAGLKSPACKIQTLSLLHTELTDACTEALCATLHAKQSLQRLHLPENYFTERSEPSFSQFKKAGRIQGLE